MCVAYSHGLILLWWHCNKLRASGFVDDDMLSLWWHDTSSVALLQCCAQHSTHTTQYWLHPILSNCGCQDKTSRCCKGSRRQSTQCNTALTLVEKNTDASRSTTVPNTEMQYASQPGRQSAHV